MNKFKTVIFNNVFMLKYIIKYVPGYAISSILIESIAIIITNIINVFVVKYVIDIYQNKEPFIKIVYFIVFLLLISLIIKFLLTYLNVVKRPVAAEILSRKIQMDLLDKVIKLPVSKYDDSEFYNDFSMTMQEADSRAMQVFDTIKDMIKYFLVMIMFIVFSAIVEGYGLVFVAVSTCISMIANHMVQKINYKHFIELIPLLRKRDYYSRVLTTKEYAKEIKITSVRKKMIDFYLDTNKMVMNSFKKYFKRYYIPINFVNEFIGNNLLISILYSGLISYKVLVDKSIDIGTFSALMVSVWSLNAVSVNFSNTIVAYSGHSEYITKLKRNLEECVVVDNQYRHAINSFESLSMNNVSFKYEGEGKNVLEDINIEINRGEKIVILGINGSGKSTLIKLITGLYTATLGDVYVNGKNIKEISLVDYYSNLAVMFQNYKLYTYSLTENVKMDIIEEKEEVERARLALEKVNIKEQYLADMNKQISNEFSKDGLNLSGGEEQKVALARVFFKNAPFIILDEPMSKLDIYGGEIIDELFECKDKTVILVTHDFSHAPKADRIYIFDSGTIIEQGKHSELLALNGKYCEMLNKKMKTYLNRNDVSMLN